MSEELLSNDKLVEKNDHVGIRTPHPYALTTRLSGPYWCYAATNFILETSFTLE